MTFRTVARRRLCASVMSGLLALSVVGPTTVAAASGDPELLAILEHPKGDIEYEIDTGTLHFFDEENAPFGVEIIDGCAIDDHLWVYGVGLSGVAMPLTVLDIRSGERHRLVLPAYEPGMPIKTILEPEALPLCSGVQVGGLPTLSGTATLTSADARARDYVDVIELLSLGRDDDYRRIVRGGVGSDVISKGSPVAAIDRSGAYDELMLLAEGRTPRHVEGVVFSGGEGMLPGRAALDKALDGITNGRVRRAFEAAQNGQLPKPLIEDLGLKGVDSVHHIRLDLESHGAEAYLTLARWIKEGGKPVELPQPVDERFTVEVARADGQTARLPLLGPLVGSEADGQRWEYGDADTLVRIIDGCELSDSFWTIAAAATDEPLELTVTDTETGTTATHSLWTERVEVSRLTDSSSLPVCD